MSAVYLINLVFVGIFGMVLSAAFCDIVWTWQRRRFMLCVLAVIVLFWCAAYLTVDLSTVYGLYPLITHLPLAAALCFLSGERLWPLIAVLTAYLCCQLRRWLALLIVSVSAGGFLMQNIAELILTLPILLLLLRFMAPSVRAVSHLSTSEKCQFGLIPALYYGFDYLTQVYTDLFSRGAVVAMEFMPFLCSVAYLTFVLYASGQERIRSQLEQTQGSLKLQVTQAVREIETLRESQQKISIYRHDLRHHMQYLSACIKNGRIEQAQNYIQEICSKMEADKVTVFCENEAANLIFSAFVSRARNHDIPIEIRAGIPLIASVSESDLCVLLSNALENALHACQKLKESGRAAEIDVSAYEKNGKFFMQIINACDEKGVFFSRGIPVTDRPGHGFGVSSICAIVERYNGIYAFLVKDGRFILRVSL